LKRLRNLAGGSTEEVLGGIINSLFTSGFGIGNRPPSGSGFGYRRQYHGDDIVLRSQPTAVLVGAVSPYDDLFIHYDFY